MHIFYSGSSNNGSLPEQVLTDVNGFKGPCLMLTHDEIYHKRGNTSIRFRSIEEQRRDGLDGRGRVWLQFLDSGAFGLYAREVKKRGLTELLTTEQRTKIIKLSRTAATQMRMSNNWLFQRKPKEEKYAYYRSEEFWKRVDNYAGFVKDHRIACDYYANLDVIFHPEMTWTVQQYLENTHKLNPIPVIHTGTPIEWVKKYVGLGYEFIGLGGYGGSGNISIERYNTWASQIFEILCPPPKRVPIIKVHGFAMTSFDLLWRFPWWSVDSSTWTKASANGTLYIPVQRKGKHHCEKHPHIITVGREASQLTGKIRRMKRSHMHALPPDVQRTLMQWLDEIGVPLGSVDKDGTMMKWGVTSHHGARKIANLRYFELLQKTMPEWPWRFRHTFRERNSFNIQH